MAALYPTDWIWYIGADIFTIFLHALGNRKKKTKQKFVLGKWFEIWSNRSVLVQRHLSCDNCKTWQDYLYSFSALKSIFGSGGKNACKTYSNFYSTIAKCIGVLGKAGSSINLFRIFFATIETKGKQRRLAACQQLCFLTFHFRVCIANTDWLVVNVEKQSIGKQIKRIIASF